MEKGQHRTSYHHGDLRAELIAAVRDLVEAYGSEGFSVAEAARRAGVSSAAPYKHFPDRPALLRAVAAEGMERLQKAMAEAAAAHLPGSREAIVSIGQAYVTFARSGPGVFRLVFGLTEGHEADPDLQSKGEACFGVVLNAVANHLGLAPRAEEARGKAYQLWAAVHGHCFLTIDGKTVSKLGPLLDQQFLTAISLAILPDCDPA